MRNLFSVLICISVVTVAGCSSEVPLAPVSGSVTLDGKPVTAGIITIQRPRIHPWPRRGAAATRSQRRRIGSVPAESEEEPALRSDTRSVCGSDAIWPSRHDPENREAVRSRCPDDEVMPMGVRSGGLTHPRSPCTFDPAAAVEYPCLHLPAESRPCGACRG